MTEAGRAIALHASGCLRACRDGLAVD